MALTNCTECGHEISDKARSCPSCGYGLGKFDATQFVSRMKIFGFAITFLFLLALLYSGRSSNDDAFNQKVAEAKKLLSEPPIRPNHDADSWTAYTQGGKDYVASPVSYQNPRSNSAWLGFYCRDDAYHAFVNFASRPRFVQFDNNFSSMGNNVRGKVSTGDQFTRFDFTYTGEGLEFPDAEFVRTMVENGRIVRFTVPIVQQGNIELVFSTDGFLDVFRKFEKQCQ